jgi:hypothetical protein
MILAKDISPEWQPARRWKNSISHTYYSTNQFRGLDFQATIEATMARMGRLGFLAVAVVFHLIYAYSIFDIYFVSPIVSGMREYSVAHREEAPAKRLVLFVGMSIRASVSRTDPGLTRAWQAMDCEQTRLSNTSPTLPLAPNRRPTGKNHVHSLPFFDRASSSMAHSACRILESLPRVDPVMSL